MKKLIVLFLAGILISAFCTSGFAQAPKLEFRASGFIDTQTFLDVNVPQRNTSAGLYSTFGSNSTYGFSGAPFFAPNNGLDHTASYWESRAHLKFDAIMGPNLSGTIWFEIDTLQYGAQGYSGFPGIGREANNFGTWTTDRTAVEVKNIYIDVGLPYFGIPVPITVRVGAQPIGVRPAMLVYSDGTGVTAGIKIDPVLIAPIYAKMLEGNDFQDDDMDVWGLHVNAKISTFTVGGYGLYYRMNTYPIWVTAPTGIAGFPATLNPVVGGTDKSHMWWMGAYADGKAGPVNLNFDFVYDFGDVRRNGIVTAAQRVGLNPFAAAAQPNYPGTRTIPKVVYNGWAIRAKVDYPWEKFNFGVVGMFATGPDTRSTSASGLPGDYTSINTFARRNSGYVVPPGSEQGPGNGESMVVYSMEGAATGGYGLANRANYAANSPGGFGGTWFAKLYTSVKTTPWWKVTFQGLYIGDTTDGGNTLGTAWRFPYRSIFAQSNAGVNMLRNDQHIGVELDLLNEFQIYNNLRFFVGFGYLLGGDALDVGHVAINALGQPIGINRSIANPWALRTRLQYTF